MYCIVPLAGPDCYLADGIRPLKEVAGTTLVNHVLRSRPWWQTHAISSEQLIFVIREHEAMSKLREYLSDCFAGCRLATISHVTRGAAHSVLAGIPLIPDLASPLIVDLGDMVFHTDVDIVQKLEGSLHIQGLIPYFESTAPQYSYLKMNRDRHVEMTAEKQVISNSATVGVYIFRHAHHFVSAMADILNQAPHGHYKGLHFVCPLYNSLIKEGLLIEGVEGRLIELSLQPT